LTKQKGPHELLFRDGGPLTVLAGVFVQELGGGTEGDGSAEVQINNKLKKNSRSGSRLRRKCHDSREPDRAKKGSTQIAHEKNHTHHKD